MKRSARTESVFSSNIPGTGTSALEGAGSPVLTPGSNCWRVERAGRLAFLVDGEAYFRAFREAVAQARHSVLILAWDLHSQVRLVRDGSTDGLPESLSEFLHAVVARQPGLHIHVLSWDYSMIYAFERQWFPVYGLHWRTHRRLHFHLDAAHPIAASHHQKVVVVDDAVAFVGGLDLTRVRWDTPEHRPDDPRRMESDGKQYDPFHDVQIVVEGEAAAALGDLARERWRRATGQRITRRTRISDRTPWPASVEPAMRDIPVGIARTEPEHNDRPEVREVEQLFLDAIKAARHSIFIETQYLTCNTVAEAMASRLREADGPEIVIIVPRTCGGVLERYTMDVLRTRVLALLRSADRYGRLGVYYPHVDGLTENVCINVHSKIMIVDDQMVRVGTANLSNRSMGLDTECDLAVEAGDDDQTRSATERFRNELLGEHLGVDAETVAETIEREGSLLAAVKHLQGGNRTLKILDQVVPEIDAVIPDAEIVDPPRPLSPELMAKWFNRRNPPNRLSAMGTALLIGLVALAAAWYLTPLKEWVGVERLTGILEALNSHPFAPVLILGGIMIGGVVAIPITLINATVIAAFGPLAGFAYGLAGSTLSAILTYGIGYALGGKTLRRYTGVRMDHLKRFLTRRGLLTVLAVRIVPVAPFAVVNLGAGALQVRFRDFVLGTVLGMAPGLGLLSVFIDRFQATLTDPGPIHVLLLGGVILGFVGAMVALNRWATKIATKRGARISAAPR